MDALLSNFLKNMDGQSLFMGQLTAPAVGFIDSTSILLMVAVFLWSLIWKGMALWKAARNGSKPWFIVLIIINTIGILDILYIYIFSKKSVKSFQAPPNLGQ